MSVEPDSENEEIPYKSLFSEFISSVRSHAQSTGKKGFVSSIHGPNTFWTSAEKELFFHGLTRYSRLRPDLIAAHIATDKTAVDVVAYIAALEKGSKRTDVDEKRTSAPSARCVSTKWIEYEEKQAALLARNEVEWERSQLATGRERILKEEKSRIRKRREKGFVRDRVARAQEQERREEYMRRVEEYERLWDQEDTMDSLGYNELSFLDSLIRTHTEANGTNAFATEDDAVDQPEPDDPLSPNSPTQIAELSGDGETSPIDMSSMNAAERRRLQKRLYMRRKRAEASGRTPIQDNVRLRPGRRTTRPQPLDPLTTSESDKGRDEGKKWRKRGLTVAQQLHLQFSELGIDVGTLQEGGLDIFNLAKFWSLWDIFAETQYNVQPVEAISSLTLQLLRACLDQFLHALIHHAIVFAEEEKAMKEHTKVWKNQSKGIKPRHVINALHFMGMGAHQSRNAILARHHSRIEGELPPVAAHLPAPPEPLPFPWSTSSGPPQHHEAFAPMVYHPCLLLEPDVADVQDVLLPSDDDEDELADARERAEGMADLAREVAEDEIDELLDQRHEEYLWRLMGVGMRAEKGRKTRSGAGVEEEEESMGDRSEDDSKSTVESEEGMDEDEDKEEEVRLGLLQGTSRAFNSLRLVAAGGNVKSQPFILDSDDDAAEKGTMSDDT